ncbi:MAG: DUF4870 domain-containing protein [Xanthomonadaceae bacterium]|nr:DUF4870 domain-containing protein [Xanthomonadaceae bacterium]
MNEETPQLDIQVSQDDRTMAMLAHLLGIISWVVGPLIVWLVNKDNPSKEFVTDQAKEALNFQITIFIAAFISGILVAVIIGIFLLTAVSIYAVVFAIIAGVKANGGERYRYPLTLRLIN